MVRLVDVAKAAGVSQGTASNVFNNPDIVRPALRDRVLAAAQEMGYAGPDPRGKLLRDGKFNSIVVLPPRSWTVQFSIGNPVYNQFLQGVSEVCDQMSANLLVAPGAIHRSSVSSALVDCIIFSRIDQPEEVKAAQLRKIPFCVVDFDLGPEVNSVRADARAGAYMAAKHLIELGHRQFGIMSFRRNFGPCIVHKPNEPRPAEAAGIATDQQKYLGYKDAFAEIGLDIAAVPMVQSDVEDRKAPGVLLDLAPNATAILSMSIMQAIGVVNEATRRGINVPQDLSVVGYNDINAAQTCLPPITTVDGMMQQKGREAAKLAFAKQKPVQILLQPTLIVRQSTGRPKSGAATSE